ncbi:MAG: thiamine pyrophosphate-binding protein [Burkholderiaceae bacterium]
MTESIRTGARILVDQLLVHGVERIFCVPGESYLAVLDALHDVTDRSHLIVNRHESGSAFMAEAEGKMTGRPGIAFVTRGPGACNAAVGLHTAYQDSTPMILFIGQVGNDFVEREAFQEVDYRRMFGPMSKWVAQIDRAERVPEYVARAFATACSGRQGPVVLALPEDMLEASASVADAKSYSAVHGAPSPTDLNAFADLLHHSERPVVIVGGSGWDANACGDLQSFAEAHALPIACAFRFQDLFDNRHAQYVGDVGIAINPAVAARIREADLIIAIGARLGEMTTSGYSLIEAPAPKQTLVHVHPDPEELGRVYQPALAINAGMRAFASALRALPSRLDDATRGDRLARVREGRRAYAAWQEEPQVVRDRPQSLNLWRIVKTLEQRLPADFLLANGAGNFATWGHRFHRYAGLRTQLAPTNGAMGYGVPAGIAAKIIAPDRTVVVLTGDGDFMMTGQELATAVQEHAGVLFIVVNNGMYGTIRMHQEKHFPGRVSGTSLINPDFAALARAYGAHGEKVDDTEAFDTALIAALAHIAETGLPVLIELRADPQIATPGATLAAM